MNMRSIATLLVLAFVGGAIAFGWFASGNDAPWMQDENAATARNTTSAQRIGNQNNAMTAGPTFIPAQPVVADSAHTGAMLLAMAARRSIENGKPIAPLLPQLQVTFGTTQPQALAVLAKTGEQPLSNAALLSEIEILAPALSRPAGTGWERIKYEMATMFVLRDSDRATPPSIARTARIRQNLIAGETETAVRLVRAMPGAANAADWIAKAEQAIAVQQALDILDHAAIKSITAPAMPLITPITPDKILPQLPATDALETIDGE